MTVPLRACLFCALGPAREYLRGQYFSDPFKQVPDLQILGDYAHWQELQEHLLSARPEVAIVSLENGLGQPNTNIIQRIAEVCPDCAIVGVSPSADPDMLIACMRAGCSQFVRWPVDPQDLQAALNRIRRMRVPAATACHRICVMGSAGGAGATTLVCNLAIELAQVAQQRCGLVDMDLQLGDVGCLFDLKPRYSVLDICRNRTEIDRGLLDSALESLPCNVCVLPRPEEVVSTGDVPPDAVERMFRVLGQMFPFVLADLPRFFSPPTIAALAGADRVLIISQLGVPHLRNATRIYEHLLQLGADEERIEFVLNRCNADFERIRPEEVAKHFRRPVFAVIPNDYKSIGASRDLGHPIMTDAPNSPARLAIRALAQRLAAEHLGADQVKPDGKLRGVLRKLRSRSRP